MAGNNADRRKIERQKRRKRNARIFRVVVALFILVLIGAAGLVAHGLFSAREAAKTEQAQAETETVSMEERTVTVGSVGDVIIHDPFLRSGEYKTSDGEYDFSACFKFMKDLYGKQTLMVANLETTFAGKDRGYSGYPLFNSPDSLPDSLHEAGVDLFLLANNHVYDTGKSGFLRTSQILEDKGYDYTGAYHKDTDKRYIIEDVDGIKVGILNYTFETPGSGAKSINGNPMDGSVADYLNSFDPRDLDSFYEELQRQVAMARVAGAQFVIFYPHWGEEYKLQSHGYLESMAQKACDLGVDAVIGGHPHVVEPVDVLTSKDGDHKTFVAYSMGNHISNQRREMISSMPSGHTEDGIMVNLQLTGKPLGKVSLTGVEVIPTWVYKKGKQEPTYYVIPIDDPDNVNKATGLDVKGDCKASYDRTQKIIGDGMKEVKEAYGFE